jgi:diaminohydroxyphosphoribosylaminopyrimidine deaminase / 5-amino-6-(5-phosphoribosylamino)uracil reductase
MPPTGSDLDVKMMRRAIALAMRGRGRVEPNPMVGCVIVRDGRVIGEGFHEQFGGPHAEVNALAACAQSPGGTEGATAYVTLEPCCHTNKKTPPCTPRVIEAKLARVVVGSVDPNPDVNGQGLDQLRAAGIAVTQGVLEESCKQLLAPFIARVVYDRPYVTLKWAETADGKVAGAGGERLNISNPRSWRMIHELRAASDAVLVGINTVINDDPLLTARNVGGEATGIAPRAIGGDATGAAVRTADPTGRVGSGEVMTRAGGGGDAPRITPRPLIRAVLDARLRIPMSSKLVRTARQSRVFVHYDRYLMDAEREKARQLREAGVEPFIAGSTHDGLRLDEVLNNLEGFGATHVLVEPGPTLARSFFNHETLTDRVWLIVSPKKSGDVAAVAGVGVPANYVKTGEVDLDGDRLIEFLNPASPLFFSGEASADFVRVLNEK